jgi:hypothetical protein
MDDIPVATNTTPGNINLGGSAGVAPGIGQAITLSSGTNFMFWKHFELIHEAIDPTAGGPL